MVIWPPTHFLFVRWKTLAIYRVHMCCVGGEMVILTCLKQLFESFCLNIKNIKQILLSCIIYLLFTCIIMYCIQYIIGTAYVYNFASIIFYIFQIFRCCWLGANMMNNVKNIPKFPSIIRFKIYCFRKKSLKNDIINLILCLEFCTFFPFFNFFSPNFLYG